MSEAPGAALGPETTLETGADAAQGTDRRQMLATALEALPEAEAPEEGEAPAAAAPASADAPAEAVAAPTVTPPSSWAKEQHELYAKADPALQQYIAKREDDMRKGVETLIPKAKMADEFERTVAPFRQNMAASGVEPIAAVQTLMQADHILRNAPMDQKVAYARQLLTQYGVDMSGTDWTNVAVDPRMAALQNELQSLRNQLTPIVQQQTDSQNQALLSEIETFKADKPHFEAVRPAMVQLLQSGAATSFQDAYDQAITPWSSLLTEAEQGRQAAALAEQRAAADKAAKTARAAAVSPRTSAPGGSPAPKAKDRREMLAELIDGVGSRV